MQDIVIPHNFRPENRPYQVKILSNPARFKFLRLHRKCGKTALASNKLILASLKNRGIAWYVAPTYKQGKEIIWRDPDMLFKYIPKEVLLKKPNQTELTVPFVSGTILSVKGADKPDNLRGPNPMIVILDEVYLMKFAVLEEILLPIAAANPKMEIWCVGTPKPMGRRWAELRREWKAKMEAGNPDYFEMTLTADESGILTAEALAEARATMTQAAFEQEMLCVEHEDDGVVFRGIDRCIIDREEREMPAERGIRYRFGIDLARVQDWTALCGINRANFTVDFFDRFNQIDYQLQKAKIEATLRRYNNAEANVDATGVGDPIVEDLIKRGLSVAGVKLTEASKSNIITNLAIMIEQGKIRIPRCHEQLIEELRIFGFEVTKSGHTRYSAPEGRHDDCVIALALAVWEIGHRLSPRNAAIPGEMRRVSKPSFT